MGAGGDGRALVHRSCGSLAASSTTATVGSLSLTGRSCWARLGTAAEQRPVATRMMSSGTRVRYERECWARLGAAAERRAGGVAHDGEDAARLALPHILLVVRVLCALQTTRHTRSTKCAACM